MLILAGSASYTALLISVFDPKEVPGSYSSISYLFEQGLIRGVRCKQVLSSTSSVCSSSHQSLS